MEASIGLGESGGVSNIVTKLGSFSFHRKISLKEKIETLYRSCLSDANRSSPDRSSISECFGDHVLPSGPRHNRWNRWSQRSNCGNGAAEDHSISQIYVERESLKVRSMGLCLTSSSADCRWYNQAGRWCDSSEDRNHPYAGGTRGES